jgi:hypothetical protein
MVGRERPISGFSGGCRVVGFCRAKRKLSGLELHRVDLRGADEPPPSDWPGGSCRDGSGRRLTAAIAEILERRAVSADQIVLSLDAPLDAAANPCEHPRRKVIPAGEAAGCRYRQCELDLKKHLHGFAREWARDVRVQPGAPLFPRIRSIVGNLVTAGFAVHAPNRPAAPRCVIEVFPSASIAMNGAAGGHATSMSAAVRRYKSSLRVGTPEEAKALAKEPLLGFRRLLGNAAVEVADAVEAVACSALSWTAAGARLGKGFDDPVDGSIAFLTAMAFAVGTAQTFGDGSDGAIVTPA